MANSSRLFILPGVQIRNLASKALAINLKRLSHDWMAAYGHPIVLAETFVDPSRFKGTSYRAAGFIPIGNTRGFGISAGNYYYHGSEKLILVRPLHPKAREWLAAPFSIPALAKGGERQPLVDLNRLNLYAENGLLARISTMPDWRTLSGTIHSLVEILSLVVCAALSGVSNNYQEVYRWIDALPWNTLRRFGCRKAYGPPSETTIRRSMQRVDKEPPKVNGEENVNVVTLMMNLAIQVAQHLPGPSFIVLDALFAVGSPFLMAKECVSSDGTRLLHVITRAKCNIAAYTDPPSTTGGSETQSGQTTYPRREGQAI